MADVLKDYYDTGNDSIAGISATTTIWAQSFIASSGYDLSRIDILAHRTGSPGAITVAIRAIDGDDKPTGANLVSGTFDGDTMGNGSGAETWVQCDMSSPYSLTNGVKYAICVYGASVGASDNISWWFADPGAYANGTIIRSTDSGAAWKVFADYDAMFRTYGSSGGGGLSIPIVQYYNKQLGG